MFYSSLLYSNDFRRNYSEKTKTTDRQKSRPKEKKTLANIRSQRKNQLDVT